MDNKWIKGCTLSQQWTDSVYRTWSKWWVTKKRMIFCLSCCQCQWARLHDYTSGGCWQSSYKRWRGTLRLPKKGLRRWHKLKRSWLKWEVGDIDCEAASSRLKVVYFFRALPANLTAFSATLLQHQFGVLSTKTRSLSISMASMRDTTMISRVVSFVVPHSSLYTLLATIFGHS